MRRFALKTGIDFAHFGLESGMVYEGTTVVYQCVRPFQFQMYTNSSLDKKERVTCEFEMAFKKSFVVVLISGMMTKFLFYVDSGVAFCDHLQV